MKTLELSTNLIGMNMFCSYGGFGNSDEVLKTETIEEGFENGVTDVHPDYFHDNFMNNKYMKELNGHILGLLQEKLAEMFDDLGMTVGFTAQGYTCPREYNFTTDNHLFDLESEDFQKLVAYCKENEEDFAEYLKENFTSYDGFISFTSNSVEGIMEDLESDDVQAWAAVISYVFWTYFDEEEIIEEGIEEFEDMLYGEFVDYTELDEWKDLMEKGTLVLSELEKDWQQELFKRDFESMDAVTKIMAKLYTEGETIQTCSLSVVQSLGYDESLVDFFEEIVQAYYEKVESNNLKLEI